MNWAINQTVAPSVWPVTLDELKSQVHITHDVQDATLTSYIEMATKYAEDYQRLAYMQQTWELVLDDLPTNGICLLRGPVQEVSSIKLYDTENNETDVPVSGFFLGSSHLPAKLVPNEGTEWPSIDLRAIESVKITYVTGYAATDDDAGRALVPDPVKYAIKLFASFADDNRAADEVEIPRSFFDLLRPARVEVNEPWATI